MTITTETSYQKLVDNLFDHQKENWPLLKENLEGLQCVQLKTFHFDGFTINVQFNPKRITSSAAKVDKKSIEERKCFLCAAHRPKEQKEVKKGKYDFLCNPFPIFNKHYTIAHIHHTPQEIGNSFPDLLDISKSVPNLICFYNAPKCGASAPDHLHFQAGNRGFIPLENDYPEIVKRYGKSLVEKEDIKVTAINDTLRRYIVFESMEKSSIIELFTSLYLYLKKESGNEEPMMNILSCYKKGWKILVYLRDNHRPWQFFEEGEENILLSPASVDMGGTLITPLEKDFQKLTKDDIIDIFKQVSYAEDKFNELCKFF
jgi:ATP adenylyltransferase/5',5'''-P-1,P-4-tetraphosphate phosphorylase II